MKLTAMSAEKPKPHLRLEAAFPKDEPCCVTWVCAPLGLGFGVAEAAGLGCCGGRGWRAARGGGGGVGVVGGGGAGRGGCGPRLQAPTAARAPRPPAAT